MPPEAIREVVINAIVHRNYDISGPSKISIYDDRIEVFSPGNFPGPMPADRVNIGVTYIRNTIITRVFRDSGIIEKLGSGFIALFESYQQRGLPMPVVQEGAGFVKCILPGPGKMAQSEYDAEIDAVLQILYIEPEVSTHTVTEHLNVTRSTAGRLLAKLTKQGVLQKVGKGSATRYRKR